MLVIDHDNVYLIEHVGKHAFSLYTCRFDLAGVIICDLFLYIYLISFCADYWYSLNELIVATNDHDMFI